MLYIIAVDPLVIMLRQNSDIKRIPIPGTDIDALLFQHPDDTTLTVDEV